MARGKQTAAAAVRKLADAETRISELERELARERAAAHQRETELREQVTAQGWDISRRTAERVQELLTARLEELTNGLGTAMWKAQRLAMTEHLTWLFFSGLVTWDRFEGDREVLKFLATHGDIKAWFIMTGKHGHRYNHADRRARLRVDATKAMLDVLADISRAEKNADIRAERKALDDLVEHARDAFTNVELTDIMRDGDWVIVEPSEADLAIHREIMADFPRFAQVAARA